MARSVNNTAVTRGVIVAVVGLIPNRKMGPVSQG
jgi:hypothetical protein